MRASVIAEKAGVASVSVVTSAFIAVAKNIARAYGLGLPIAEIPHGLGHGEQTAEIVDAIVGALELEPESVGGEGELDPRDTVLSGTIDEINDEFAARLWTDGLPIVPPTVDRVERFLRFTDRPADEELGVLLPERRRATVWNVAVNGVMAGCKPEYMPILLAVAECVADPEFRLEDQGSTPGWEPMIVVNGPIVEELGFNVKAGALRMANRANSSIGRFLNLFMRNVAGLRPGLTSKGVIGGSFFVALAENEEACRANGWLPMSADTRGFEPGQNVVTVRGVVGQAGPVYLGPRAPAGMTVAENAVERMRQFVAEGQATIWSVRTGLLYEKWSALFIVSPSIAEALASEGWSKADLRRHLFEHATVPASMVERFGDWLFDDWTIASEVESGRRPAQYAESDEPDRPVPVFMDPGWIEIVVAGEPAMMQTRGYMNNHEQGWPVSREIALPRAWAELREVQPSFEEAVAAG
jgi:hypothetical protein